MTKIPATFVAGIYAYYYVNQLHSLSDSNGYCNGGAYHRVVAHSKEAHHLDVCGNR